MRPAGAGSIGLSRREPKAGAQRAKKPRGVEAKHLPLSVLPLLLNPIPKLLSHVSGPRRRLPGPH